MRSIRKTITGAMTLAFAAIVLPLLLSSCAGTLSPAQPTVETASPTDTPSPVTPTFCPQATPEPLWVDPVVSPTDLLTQTITVFVGRGEAVTVSLESGVYAQIGQFSAYGSPARVRVNLLPDTTHHLTVSARIAKTEVAGCPYGGYTLTTQIDREGNPLTIVQEGNGAGLFYLPVLLARTTIAAPLQTRLDAG
jgi:hypothetical protein